MSKIIHINSNNSRRGKSVDAIYDKPELPDYANNPLIESLPKILTTEKAIEKLAHFPKMKESMRNLPDHLKFHQIEAGLKFFSPLNVHLDLERRISCLLRSGYIERNPLKTGFYKKLDKAMESFDKYENSEDESNFNSTKHLGFNITGISGIGKSQTIERIFNIYPQVIRHSKYKKRNFTNTQLVWLKLDCPFDGSIKGLCLNFFQEVDRIFNTNYLRNYGSNKTVDQMLPYIALVAANHHLGVWVIDEIQRLSLSKSGGAEKMLNFFTQLVNIVGVPIILVGTYKALPLFSSDFSQMRRGTGQGDLIWDRMAYDEEWKEFIESLWDYQYTDQIAALRYGNTDLSKVLYEETQGITDLAIKAFIFAQQRAIEDGKKKINASFIRSAAKDKFRLLQNALKAMKNKDKRALTIYEDLYPVFKDKASYQPNIIGELAETPEVKVKQANKGKVLTFDNNSKAKSQKESKKLKEKEKSLPNLLKKTKKDNQDIYTEFSNNNYTKSGDEFLEGGLN